MMRTNFSRWPLKEYALLLLLTICIKGLNSQTLPPFKMYRSDKTIFDAASFPEKKACVIIYFDPECDHCQKLMKELFTKIEEFNKVEIVMVTFKSTEEVAAFEKTYNTKHYANVTVGTEGVGFYLRNYYQLTTMPFTALYDKERKLRFSYRKDTYVDDLITRVKKM